MKSICFFMAIMICALCTTLAFADSLKLEDDDILTGEFIIGEGENAGKIEMLGIPIGIIFYNFEAKKVIENKKKYRSFILTPDTEGRYIIPYRGEKPKSYITLNEEGAPTLHVFDPKEEHPTYPVYDNFGEIIERKKGNILEGAFWSTRTQVKQKEVQFPY
jgi:hypothetical protein